TRCYVDASWKDNKSGFGIFIRNTETHAAIFLQAVSTKYTYAIQAKLAGIIIAYRVCSMLHLEETVLISDNQ
ncbi:hypothetical protein ABZP36_028593, partial [Zizania latifolia]